jgi:hypothetical protein
MEFQIPDRWIRDCNRQCPSPDRWCSVHITHHFVATGRTMAAATTMKNLSSSLLQLAAAMIMSALFVVPITALQQIQMPFKFSGRNILVAKSYVIENGLLESHSVFWSGITAVPCVTLYTALCKSATRIPPRRKVLWNNQLTLVLLFLKSHARCCGQYVIGYHCAQIGRVGQYSIHAQVSILIRHDACAPAARNVIRGRSCTLHVVVDGTSIGDGGGAQQ